MPAEVLKPEQVQRLLNEVSQGAERRTRERHHYSDTALFAPSDQFDLPAGSAFLSVTCCDLSSAGVSFYWPERPTFDFGVIVLGKPGAMVALRLQVLHHRDPSAATPQFWLGCRFVERLQA